MEKALHIGAKKDDIAPIVILPGDPLRAKYIAKNYLTDVILVNKIRNMLGYTGYYKGTRVSVMSSGMGMPSMSIYAMELFKFYDVKKIIRIGTCGAVSEDAKILDVLLGDSYYTHSNFAESTTGRDDHLTYASAELNNLIIKTAELLKEKVIMGKICTMDNFGPYIAKEVLEKNYPADLNAIGEEMEGFALVYIANMLNKEATVLATVVDSKYSDKVVTPEERETSLNKMIILALEAIIK